MPFWSLAYANERILSAQYDRLGVLPPTYEPRATGHVPEMHELIAKLIADGHAYPATDGSGDVYFDVGTFPRYGQLSGQKPDNMQAAPDGPDRAKRDPRDFALWKGAKADEPAEAQWPSPWGRGRPGWHIECSAMCWRYLGRRVRHPRRRAGPGVPAPRERARPVAGGRAAVRPVLGAPRAAQPRRLEDGQVGRQRDRPAGDRGARGPAGGAALLPVGAALPLGDRLLRRGAAGGGVGVPADRGLRPARGRAGRSAVPRGKTPAPRAAFVEAMDDDLNTSQALAVVHDLVREGNTALAEGDTATVGKALASRTGDARRARPGPAVSTVD